MRPPATGTWNSVNTRTSKNVIFISNKASTTNVGVYIFTRLCLRFTDSALLWVRCCHRLVRLSLHTLFLRFFILLLCPYILVDPNLLLPSFSACCHALISAFLALSSASVAHSSAFLFFSASFCFVFSSLSFLHFSFDSFSNQKVRHKTVIFEHDIFARSPHPNWKWVWYDILCECSRKMCEVCSHYTFQVVNVLKWEFRKCTMWSLFSYPVTYNHSGWVMKLYSSKTSLSIVKVKVQFTQHKWW